LDNSSKYQQGCVVLTHMVGFWQKIALILPNFGQFSVKIFI
jgi:hypothetical protein